MNIQPGFTRHWKVKSLVRMLDDRAAPVYLLNLWGHCQTAKAWVFDIPIAGIAEVCDYDGDPDRLNTALVEGGWIERDGATVTICGWDEYNAGLIARWSNGARGGRPKTTQIKPKDDDRKPIGSRQVSEPEPAANRGVTNIIECNGIGWDRMGGDKTNTPPNPQRGNDEGFDAFWSAYPTRNGKRGNKGESLSEWRKLSPTERANVMIATKNLAVAVASGTLPKDAQRFLRPPNKRSGADPAYLEWLEVTQQQRPNDRMSMDNGVLAKLRRNTAMDSQLDTPQMDLKG